MLQMIIPLCNLRVRGGNGYIMSTLFVRVCGGLRFYLFIFPKYRKGSKGTKRGELKQG